MNKNFSKKPHFIRAKKSLGQNFCCDERIPREILSLLDAAPGQTIWEIGPGKGALTKMLVETGANLHLFEIDLRMQEILCRDFPMLGITWGDFLELKDHELPKTDDSLLVCGNLPYYCGTPIIKRFLENGPRATRLVFLLQQEVALKAAANSNSRDYGFLSIHTAFFARARTGSTYPPSSFIPQPKVQSTILVVEPLELTQAEKEFRLEALKTVSKLFSQRRKMALPQLKKLDSQTDWEARFDNLGISFQARPENISPAKFLELFADGYL